ncbi:hypothetical protein H9Y04_44165 [Streptomyces sp. TRM66268-LWL]|uniref:Uncharacterized protein n=1 Tax=Streptomyces polyasparticus TaxID=2767826 RepID=A0ABR7SXZ7_9ACTN|nr:hypothetical protein [Streptomyces polyasparticus]MBC9719517.1 hypothetical protein [Streptomyces polyasparticus]
MTDNGRIIKIVNEREVLINLGAADGVRKGMVFSVRSPEPDDVHDPETGELLGTFSPPKTYVKVTEVHDRFCVAATYRDQHSAAGPLYGFASGPIARLMQPPTVRRDVVAQPENLPPDSLREVEVGDRVHIEPDPPPAGY